MVDPASTPERTKGDVAHAVVRATLGSIPVIGAAGAELFAYLVEEPVGKRRDEWMRYVGDALADLQGRRPFNLDALRKDPAFTDTVLQATQAALRSHDTEKHHALRNAVLNSALPTPPDSAVRQTFLRLIDEFTAWHLRLLDLFDSAAEWQRRHGVKFPPPPRNFSAGLHFTEQAFPELRTQVALYEQFWRDLYARGLVHGERIRDLPIEYDLYQSQTTALGKRFLQFIRTPE